MWKASSIGIAHWRQGAWALRTAVDAAGVRMFVCGHGSAESCAEISLWGKSLPPACEMYVRGDELHLLLPQDEDGSSRETIAGLEIVLLPIVTEEDALVIESTLSLQTQWLDVEPTVTLRLTSEGKLVQHAASSSVMFTPQALANLPLASVPIASLLVDARDHHSLAPARFSDGIVGFFGEFMEKGVIRKVQPWWIWTISPIGQEAVQGLAEQLAHRPLPLAG